MSVVPGHLFVLRGDMTNLACDAIVLSCDDHLNINDVWQPLLPDGLASGDRSNWLRLPRENLSANVFSLPAVGRHAVYAAITTLTTAAASPDLVARRIVEGIEAAARGLEAQDGRHLPLIAVPLVGTGAGGLRGRRGEVIQVLLPQLRAAAQGFDIALVLWQQSDLAAVQHLRTDDADWTDLTELQRDAADSLGERAARGQLSLFIGAGLSRPVGLPDWSTLLKELANEAEIPLDWSKDDDPVKVATPIVKKLGIRFHDEMRKRLTSTKHGIGHGLLAGLEVRQMVTTNFDECMEIALDAGSKDQYRVLTQFLADAGMPWLLKLHGDINRPGSLVFDDAAYDAHAEEYAALHGVVQSLMLTSHLLFVGFSLTDRNFLKLATAVTRVRQDAKLDDGRPLAPAGTALALTNNDLHREGLESELEFLAMMDSTDFKPAARILEIFLDRLAWSAARTRDLSAEYLLDDNYASGLSEPDRALRDALNKFEAELPPLARSSVGWDRVEQMSASLGGRGGTKQGRSTRHAPRDVPPPAVTRISG